MATTVQIKELLYPKYNSIMVNGTYIGYDEHNFEAQGLTEALQYYVFEDDLEIYEDGDGYECVNIKKKLQEYKYLQEDGSDLNAKALEFIEEAGWDCLDTNDLLNMSAGGILEGKSCFLLFEMDGNVITFVQVQNSEEILETWRLEDHIVKNR